MNGRALFLTCIAFALTYPCTHVYAAGSEVESRTHVPEVSDQELGAMRGRFTIGNNTVAWFGVSMISTWTNGSGQVVQGALTMDMNFSGNHAVVSFVPTVSITAVNAPLPAAGGAMARSVNSAGLANIGGILQSTQIAGDGNQANNLAHLNISYGTPPPAGQGSSSGDSLSTGSDGASASASYDNGVAQVLLNIAGQGTVRQWIHDGSIGQSIALTSDNQVVSNMLNVSLVLQAMNAGPPLNQSAAQNVAQSIGLTRGLGAR